VAVLLLHETHKVIGIKEFEFEAAYREGWLSAMSATEDARLLWYFHLAHGSNISYRFITITALKDFATWEQLALRMQSGDLRSWAAEVDRCRYQLDAKLLVPLTWSPMQAVDLTAARTAANVSHELAMYVEDTVRPEEAKIEDTIEAAGHLYRARTDGPAATHLVGAFQPFFGAGRRREIVLLHQVDDKDLLAEYYRAEKGAPGSLWPAVNERSELGDSWESHVLRTSSWSPYP
jgi:hypothetical protein